MPHLACTACPETFPSEQSAKTHFIENHTLNKCQLCNREQVARASFFCSTCKLAFLSEINQLEDLNSEVKALEHKLNRIRNHRDSIKLRLKTRFLLKHAELFCEHEVPKSEKCEKCDKFFEKDIRSSKRYIHIEL